MDMRSLLFFLILPILSVHNIYAQEVDSLLIKRLDSVVVSATRLHVLAGKAPLMVYTVDSIDLKEAQSQLGLDYALAEIPGVFAMNSNNYAQDLRISMRGFGARSAFGIRGVKIMVDGIPQSTPDGQAQLDNLDLGVVTGMEVINGPASGMYGNAAGGVVNIATEGVPSSTFAEARYLAGSFGLNRFQLKGGIRSEKWSAIVQGSNTRLDGYREHSGMKNTSFNTKIIARPSDNSHLQLIFGYVDSPEAQDPGSLDHNAVPIDRTGARPQNRDYNSGEAVQQAKLGITWQQKLKKDQQLNARLFYQWRDFSNRLPFEAGGIVDLERNFVGGGVNYQLNKSNWKWPYRLKVGIDIEQQVDDRQRYNNLLGIRANRSFDQEESFTNVGLFAIQELEMSARLLLLITTRFDVMELEAKDRYLLDGNDSGSQSYEQFNPGIGLHYNLKKGGNIYANFTTSFETPALSELSTNPLGGGFNQSLKPQQAQNLEIGYRKHFSLRWSLKLSSYYIKLQNELLPFELAAFPGRDFYRNAGKSERFGIEANLRWFVFKDFIARFSYTYAQYIYQQYEIDGNSFADNYLPGIPQHQATLSGHYHHSSGFLAMIQLRYVGDVYLNDTNTEQTGDYILGNLRVAYQWKKNKWVLSPFAGLNNFTNTSYNDNLRINAFGGRYFEPAPGLNWYSGLKLRYNIK